MNQAVACSGFAVGVRKPKRADSRSAFHKASTPRAERSVCELIERFIRPVCLLSLQFHATSSRLLDGVIAYDSRRTVDGSAVCREILNFRILLIRVDLFSPSLAAAPLRPPTTQLVSRRVDIMWALSASASVHAQGIGILFFVSSATGIRSSTPPFVRMTDL